MPIVLSVLTIRSQLRGFSGKTVWGYALMEQLQWQGKKVGLWLGLKRSPLKQRSHTAFYTVRLLQRKKCTQSSMMYLELPLKWSMPLKQVHWPLDFSPFSARNRASAPTVSFGSKMAVPGQGADTSLWLTQRSLSVVHRCRLSTCYLLVRQQMVRKAGVSSGYIWPPKHSEWKYARKYCFYINLPRENCRLPKQIRPVAFPCCKGDLGYVSITVIAGHPPRRSYSEVRRIFPRCCC